MKIQTLGMVFLIAVFMAVPFAASAADGFGYGGGPIFIIDPDRSNDFQRIAERLEQAAQRLQMNVIRARNRLNSIFGARLGPFLNFG